MNLPILSLLEETDVNLIFDFVCAGNYFAGQLEGKMPVEESRKVFKHIKKLLKVNE